MRMIVIFQITVFQPNVGKGIPVGERPPQLPPDHMLKLYNFHSLPQKYIKRYQYAARFVRLVRSKTPKVTLYSKQAKCMLMENMPNGDFEALFYDGECMLY